MGAGEFILGEGFESIREQVETYSQQGQRVLLLVHSQEDFEGQTLPGDLRLLGLVLLSDKIRREAPRTLRYFADQGVDLKVISGDNPVTVSEVARRVGVSDAEKYISLEGLSDQEVASVANKYTVFGRVSPEQKAILVKSIKSEGNTVAMTGDGVNDILALKEADCAVSVASGSEAAKNVSHIVLLDNNFSSMPKVVFEGRRVINNITSSSSMYLMKTLHKKSRKYYGQME